jgi:hypothetical protein
MKQTKRQSQRNKETKKDGIKQLKGAREGG